MVKPIVVWRFRDGKPGHDRQSAGLLGAMATSLPLAVHEVDAPSITRPWWAAICRQLPVALAALPRPQLLVGAGHACEWPMLAAYRCCGGRSVYLMKPTLPCRTFDLCFIPTHDGVSAGPHVVTTQGVLNDIVPDDAPRDGPVPILVGGPSRHHAWDEAAVLRQIASVVFGSRERHFVISDSRRTPPSTSAALADFAQQGVAFVAHRDVATAWLVQTLIRAPAAWVTADSMSMLFEALTAGCAVGVIDVPAARDDRITRIVPALVGEGLVVPLAAWLKAGQLPRPARLLAEARRCASIAIERLLLAVS